MDGDREWIKDQICMTSLSHSLALSDEFASDTMLLLFKHRSETSSEFPSSTHWSHWRFTKNGHGRWGPGCFGARKTASCESSRWKAAFHMKSPIHCLVYDGQLSFQQKTWHVMMSCVEGDKVTFRSVQDPQVFGVLQELEPIYNDECILHVWSDSYKEDTAEDQRSKKPEISGTSLRSRQLLHGRMPMWRGLWCGILVKSFGESEQKWQVILMSSGYRKSWSTYMPGPATVYLLRKIWQWKMQYLSDAIKIYLYFMI